MEVILLEPVKNLGKVGDLVRVKNGYARNFLLPENLAIRATNENKQYFESRKKDIEAENAKKLKEAEAVAKKINGAVVSLIRQAGEDGRLYGSVSAADIATAINETLGQNVSRKQVVLHEPIKYIGVHTVEIHLHGDESAKIHPNVARSETEAKEAKKRFEGGEVVMEGAFKAEAEEEKPAAKPAKKAETEDADEKPEQDKKESKVKKSAAKEAAEEEAKPEKSEAKAKKASAKDKKDKKES